MQPQARIECVLQSISHTLAHHALDLRTAAPHCTSKVMPMASAASRQVCCGRISVYQAPTYSSTLRPRAATIRASRLSPCAVTDNGRTPASLAAENGHANCLAELVEQGAAAMFSTADADQRMPAHYAAQSGHAACLDVLAKWGAQVQLTALDCNSDHAECLDMLATHGGAEALTMAVAAAGACEKWTPAHFAASAGHAA
jgi:hypothetical protein